MASGIRPALATLIALLVLAAPAGATTQPFGGLEQFPGKLGCISEDGSGGACADGNGLAGATAVTAYWHQIRRGKRVGRSIRRHRKGLRLTAVATARLADGRTDRGTRRVRVLAKRSP